MIEANSEMRVGKSTDLLALPSWSAHSGAVVFDYLTD
jgi:hypothetical protein